jgi:hypothetical protein
LGEIEDLTSNGHEKTEELRIREEGSESDP